MLNLDGGVMTAHYAHQDLLAELNRSNLKSQTVQYMRRGKPWQADLLLVRLNGKLGVVKDYSKRPWLYRIAVGMVSTWREKVVYQKLQGLPGVPRLFGKLDRYALVVEYIPGKDASQVKPGLVGPEFFNKLQKIVDRIHERGIVLCDLRHTANIIVSDQGEPYLVDFCTAFERGSQLNIFKKWLYQLFHQDDLLGIIKLKKHLAPDLLSDEERWRLERGIFLQGPAIRLRNFSRRWLKKLVQR
jgi:serine/threonine protein kinase